MLVFVCFMSVYFVIKNIISSPYLAKRCLYALVISSALVSAYGIYQNYFSVLSTDWQDVAVFAEIRGRVVSLFDNPNVLGEFLILIFPITLGLMTNAKKLNERFLLFSSAVMSCCCLVFTWSRGAWIGCVIATLLFLCVSSKYFFTAGLLSLPWAAVFLFSKSDSVVLTRLTSFSDSSVSYRVSIWRGVLHMLEDVGLYGIGIGEGAFTKIYPVYSLAGIEAAPHAHNLYLQIAVELGFFALTIFLVFIFLFAQFSLSFCKTAMNRSNKLLCLGIFSGVLALLVQGMTDYAWYNYRVYLMMWLVCGLASASVRTGSAVVERYLPDGEDETAEKSSVNVEIRNKRVRKNGRRTSDAERAGTE
jgi:O-antigen ligase